MIARMLLGVAAATMLMATPAWAQLAPEWPSCVELRFTPDERVRSCTVLIKSGREAPKNLAAAYSNRGNAYAAKGDLDRAIADHSAAIRINTDFANAYLNRGSAYFRKGDFDRAIADGNEAIRLASRLGMTGTLILSLIHI